MGERRKHGGRCTDRTTEIGKEMEAKKEEE